MADNIIRIAFGCDHAGYDVKEEIMEYLAEYPDIEVLDYGTNSPDSVDYPDFVHPVAEAVEDNKVDWGILCCGSGNGVAITANKYQHVRAALCWQDDIARLARNHNNANVICIPARFIKKGQASEMVNTFLHSEFEGGRHARRVNKIINC